MILAFSVPDWLAEVGKVAAAIAAILGAAALVVKSPIGRAFTYIYRRLFGEPLTEKFTQVVTEVVTPQLDRLEEKNDRQHAENKAAIEGLTTKVDEHRFETRDHLFELRQELASHRAEMTESHAALTAHFDEAAVRDRRIDELELRGVDVQITATPTTGETPAVEPADPEGAS